jgi:hypothetical protein
MPIINLAFFALLELVQHMRGGWTAYFDSTLAEKGRLFYLSSGIWKVRKYVLCAIFSAPGTYVIACDVEDIYYLMI